MEKLIKEPGKNDCLTLTPDMLEDVVGGAATETSDDVFSALVEEVSMT